MKITTQKELQIIKHIQKKNLTKDNISEYDKGYAQAVLAMIETFFSLEGE